MLPAEQEAQEVLRADRLDLPPEAVQRVAMDTGQQSPVTELLVIDAFPEVATQDDALALQSSEAGGHPAGRLRGPLRELSDGERAQALDVATEEREERLFFVHLRPIELRR